MNLSITTLGCLCITAATCLSFNPSYLEGSIDARYQRPAQPRRAHAAEAGYQSAVYHREYNPPNNPDWYYHTYPYYYYNDGTFPDPYYYDEFGRPYIFQNGVRVYIKLKG